MISNCSSIYCIEINAYVESVSLWEAHNRSSYSSTPANLATKSETTVSGIDGNVLDMSDNIQRAALSLAIHCFVIGLSLVL